MPKWRMPDSLETTLSQHVRLESYNLDQHYRIVTDISDLWVVVLGFPLSSWYARDDWSYIDSWKVRLLSPHEDYGGQQK